MVSQIQLTFNDTAVLSALFDPEAPLDGAAQVIPTPISSPNVDDPTIVHIQRRERSILTDINTEKPTLPSICAAIAQLSDLIQQHPQYASAYNNRAQARRLLSESSDTLISLAANNSLVLTDLSKAIEFASPKYDNDSVSPDQARVLASAYTHRASLIYKASRSESSRQLLCEIPTLQGLDKNALEEMASRDFSAGGRYGNRMARQLAVQTNPYAKLCGSIVREALRKEMESCSRTRLDA